MEIKQSEKSFFIGADEATSTAKMVYHLNEDESLVTIDHTNVSEKWTGQGIGKLLLDTLVQWARKENKKILPLCPFAKGQMEKNDAYRDMIYSGA